ncbi:hypothetical protein NDU88_003477, partial [Pleurodeles waltl]
CNARKKQECLTWIGKTESVDSWTSRKMKHVADSSVDTSSWTQRPTFYCGTWTTP